MSRKLALGLLVMAAWPTVALGQVSINAVQAPTLATYTFNQSNCGGVVDLQWSYVSAALLPQGNNITTGLRLWATSASCGDQQLSTDLLGFTEIPYLTIRSKLSGPMDSLTLSALPMFAVAAVDGGTTVTCGDSNVQVSNYVCGAIGYVPVGSSVPIYQHATYLTVTYDTKPPAVPTITGAAGEDSAALINFSAASDAVSVSATATQLDGGSPVQVGGVSSTGSILIKNLTNDVTYSVTLTATDAAGNESGASSAVEVTPVLTNGFFAVLRNDGSTETGNGGCAIAGGGLLPLAALALARALTRRSSR